MSVKELACAYNEYGDANPGSMDFGAHRYSTDSSIEKFARALRYIPDTGDLLWRNGHRAGKIAGYLTHKGYRHVTVEGHEVGAHRVVWALVHGEWPSRLIDHRNGIKDDNRPGNLRECDHQGNAQNTAARTERRPMPKGVKLGTRCKNAYEARIVHKGKCIYLGMFKTTDEAHAAYLAAKARLHEFQPFVRTPAGKDTGL